MQETDNKIQKEDSTQSTYRVGVVLVPGFAAMSHACVTEPLRAANLLSGEALYSVKHYAHQSVTDSSGPVTVSQCAPIGATLNLDLVLVVAGGDPFSVRDDRLTKWLRDLDRRGVQIGGVSGGPVLLAQGGLMEGRRMTVHWEHADALSQNNPNLIIEKRLYVIDRDRVTCGGGTAPLDFLHALIADHHGREFAGLVSDWFLHTDIRAAAAPQRQGPSEGAILTSEPIRVTLSAMENHIGDPLSLAQLAMVADVSSRHLNRLFVNAFSESTMAHYRRLRLGVARRLLRGSSMSIAGIAEATGFSSAAHLSAAYLRHFALRPSAERRSARTRT